MKKKDESGADFLARLRCDPEWVANQRRREEELAKKEAFYTEAEKPIIVDLRAVGVNVDSVWDLVNISTPYPSAVPVLLKHLTLTYPDRVRDGIARALAVTEATSGWSEILHEYLQSENDTEVKDGLACAIAITGAKNHIEDLIQLISDRRHGKSRMLLVNALRKSRDPRAKAMLDELIDDPEIGVEVRRTMPRKRK